MSYILEALKKSEQERGHGGSPGIQTIHTSSLNYRTNRKQLWPWLLFAILCVNLLMLVYFMFGQSGNDAALVPQAPVATTPAVAITPVVPRQQPVIAPTPAPAPQPKPVAMKPEAMPQPVAPIVTPPPTYAPVQNTSVAPAPAAIPVIEVDELPADVGSHVPHMTFSAHVYSSNPKQRSVIINDMFLEEGDMMSTDLKLIEITNDGVIFEFRGYRFHRSVLAGWE